MIPELPACQLAPSAVYRACVVGGVCLSRKQSSASPSSLLSLPPYYSQHKTPTLPSLVLGGAATCSEGLVKCFLLSSPCLLGQHGSCSIANRSGTPRKQLTKPLEQVAAPHSTYVQRFGNGILAVSKTMLLPLPSTPSSRF